ncbi:MAG: hypothetical protein ACHQ53_06625 [Polyangiales bacterium]
MRACTGWLLCAAALSSACTDGHPDVVVEHALVQGDGGQSRGTAASGAGSNQTSSGNGPVGAPDAKVPIGPGFGIDAGSPCDQFLSTYQALDYVTKHNCEIPDLVNVFGPVVAFASQNQPSRMGETRPPTYCDLTPGSNPVYYEVPDGGGVFKLCPVYCNAAMAWLSRPDVDQTYRQCRFGS